MHQREWLDGREAAAFLGVKRATLYAYASRGLVQSVPGEGGRGRRYRAEDLDRLKARHDARSGHGPVAAAALRWGEPVLESAITAIDESGPRYRGQRAVDLAERGVTFERVAELIWSGDLPESARWAAHELTIKPSALDALLGRRDVLPLATLALAIPALAAADGERFAAAPSAELPRARAILLRIAALLGVTWDSARAIAAVSEPTVARAMLTAFGARGTKRSEAALDAALVVAADHELNASAFAVRVAASAGADLYACMSAGLATLSGPRHGASCDRVEALVREAGRADRARLVVQDRARRGEAIPGFGHPLYPKGDPRFPILMQHAREIAPDALGVRTMIALVDAMHAAGMPPPTIDVGLVALASALRLPEGAATCIFAIGRAAGWVAHVIEQREQRTVLRPRARYVGK